MRKEQNPSNHPKYRPDIDGLRAIAVLAVVTFHAFPKVMKGGFVGVDIFFVISGFLISTIIFRSLENKIFSFSDFYSRRIRRIFPALSLVLFFSLILGWFTLDVVEYTQLGKHISGGSKFISNFILWNESGYFDNTAESKPLLHLWSLAIEEQFYVFYPLLIYFLHRFRINILYSLIVIFLCSFGANLYETFEDTTVAFYSPFCRTWELAVGGILAQLLLTQRHLTRLSAKQATALFFAGILFVGVAILAISKERAFPGWWAVLPTVGAALLILSGAQSSKKSNPLSNGILVKIGLISYPLYLWHWPLLTFGRLVTGTDLSITVAVGLLLLSLLFSWATFQFLEKRIRIATNNRLVVSVLCVLIAVAGILGHNVFVKKGLETRYQAQNNDYRSRAKDLLDTAPDLVDCSDIYKHLNEKEVRYSRCVRTRIQPNVALLGDSHADHLFYGFVNNPNDFFRKVVIYQSSSCPPTLGYQDQKWCGAPFKLNLETIEKSPDIKYVVLGASKYEGPQLLPGFSSTISRLLAAKKKVIFVIDPIAMQGDPNRCTSTRLPVRDFFWKYPSYCDNIKWADIGPAPKYFAMVEQLKAAHKDVFFYDANKFICDSEKCRGFIDGKLLYADWGHLSIYGSKLLINT